jgi:hypothetical protein
MQKTGPNPFNAIFSSYWATTLFQLARTPSGRNENYDEKRLYGENIFQLFLLSAQVS